MRRGSSAITLRARCSIAAMRLSGWTISTSTTTSRLKQARLEQLEGNPRFRFVKLDVADRTGMTALFEREKFPRVIHLAAQAGVRYSLTNPDAYIDSNVVGFMNVLEGCRHSGVEHLVYASTSSVYGANTKMPFSVHQNVDHPLSMYAATKKANELMAHTYSYLHGLPTTGLRFSPSYGPFGRPDMALFLFTRNILAGKPIDVFNYGNHRRDFTYVDDIVEGVIRASDRVAKANPTWDGDQPDPATQPRAVPDLQHRQQSTDGVDALYRGDRSGAGAQGHQEHAADAAGRRAGHIRGCRRPGAGRGLQASDPG